MPHQCTNCGRTFADGSKEMLSGCPDCGGNKFQFVPSSRSDSTTANDPEPSAADDAAWPPADESGDSPPSGGVREWPDSARRPEHRPSRETDRPTSPGSGTDAAPSVDDDAEDAAHDAEDAAQADARSSVIAPDELPEPPDRTGHSDSSRDLPDSSGRSAARESPTREPPQSADEPPDHGRVVSEPTDDRPSIDELREELNEQFESIKIVRPGEYELNLMELYNREEYIVSLEEDGRYVIDVPDSWRGAE